MDVKSFFALLHTTRLTLFIYDEFTPPHLVFSILLRHEYLPGRYPIPSPPHHLRFAYSFSPGRPAGTGDWTIPRMEVATSRNRRDGGVK